MGHRENITEKQAGDVKYKALVPFLEEIEQVFPNQKQ